ncbi:MAG: GlsB/YeaQ/YmgE family stress response membrane protein [Chloroflexota bacterium]
MNEAIIGNITLAQILAYIVLGALAGSLVGRLLKNRRKGYGLMGNLIVGIIGAIIGGILFDLLEVGFGRDVVITLNDFIAALVGAFIFVGLVWIINRR